MMRYALASLLALALLTAACGGGLTGMPGPAPTPTPQPGTGTVTGMVVVAPTAAAAAAVQPARPLRSTTGRPVFAPGRLIVRFRVGAAAAAAADLHRQVDAAVIVSISRLNAQVVRLPSGASVAQAMAAYRASPLVEFVEQDAYAYRMATPTDPLYGSQWHYPQINLPAAWDLTTGGGVIVAVIDSGIRADHPDLNSTTVTGFDFASDPDNGDGDGRDPDPTDPGCPDIDPSDLSHGTHVAGTVNARTNNGAGGAGVNWGGVAATRIMALRVLGQVQPFTDPNNCGVGYYSDIADAIIYAADHGARVINMSLGGTMSSGTVDSAITYARALGVTLVAAAGNNFCGAVSYPARNANVIAVAATTNTNARAPYSSCGPEIDVAAPGGSSGAGVVSATWSPNAGFVYASFQGTSMATPHVSGLVALMISRGITGPANIQSILEGTAADLGPSGKDNEFGSGLVNAGAAVAGGAAATRLRVFSGVVSGNTVTVQSDLVVVQSTGAFTITNAQAGTKTVIAWQDVNGNGVIDGGDTFARRDNVVITSGGTTTGINLTAQRYSGVPMTVVGTGMGR